MCPCHRVVARNAPELRRQTVELVRSSGRSIPQIADELGVSPQSLRNSVRKTKLDSRERRDGLTSDEREELRRLRRENRRLQQEGEILEAAAAFFVREIDRR
jgi:transposase